MQSGMRGRQSRIAFQELLSKARGNIETRNSAPPQEAVEVRVEAAPPPRPPRALNASVW